MSIYVNARNLMTNYDESDIQAPYNDLLANASGIVTPGAMVVAPNSGMTIQVATGAVLQYISSLGNFYRIYSDAVTNLTIANNSSGSTRIDLICVKFDPTITPDANASNIATILIVLGTAGAGIPATPTNHYVLAEITVASGAASIGAGQITDKRAAVTLSTLLKSAIILTTGGGTTAYTLTPSPAITAYATGQEFVIKMNATNTGASTINVSGLGAKSLTKGGATALASGDLLIDGIYTITYDGTQFQVSGGAGSGAAFWSDVQGTPTRVSDTQFTITDTSNANLYDLLFKKGTILKWLESSTFQTAMVISSSYGANAVTINIVGDSLTAGFTAMKYAIPKAMQETFIIPGTLAALTDASKTWYPSSGVYILSADLTVKTAGSGTGSTVIDINVSGSTKFTTKPTLTTTGTSDIDNVADNPSTEVAAEAPVTIDVDSITATTAQVEAYIRLYYYPSDWRYRS